ncbi:hypothetical protein ABE236_00110 [Priestia endophytica]|uniref:hypothetical protein n=1 Tax=Priestia endophytica TaxID=135735 RepID=UPI003D2D50E7
MGGREGGRGYLYQSIATLIGTLADKEWKYVQVEVESELDKIDIQWDYEENKKKVVQVKSSQNNISRSNIIHWLEDLIQDAPTADKYELFLIGNTSDNTSNFISKLNGSTELPKEDEDGKIDVDYDDLKKLESSLSKIEVKVENFDLESLEAKIHVRLSKLLLDMGHLLSPTVVDLIGGGMLNEFTKFSTQGAKVSRDQFINKFEEWLKFNYSEIRRSGLVKKVLNVEFYLKEQVDFSTKIKALKLNLSHIEESYKSSLLKIINDIKEIILPPYNEKIITNEPTNKTGLVIIGGSNIPPERAEISKERKEILILKTKDLLGIDIGEDFFYLGQLQSVASLVNWRLISGTYLKGEDVERKKGILIEEFIFGLEQYECTIKYLNYLEEFSIVPLVLRNTGTSSDEDIKVNIKLPKNIKFVESSTLEFPSDWAIEVFSKDNCLLKILRHQREYDLEEFHGSKRGTYISSTSKPLMRKERIRQAKSELTNQVNELFNFEVFEGTDYNVLQFSFTRLYASKNMAFPSFLLVKANESFNIDYDITSKNLGTQLKGSLYYEV